MAAIARPGVRKNRNRPMNKKLTATAPSVASGKVPAPVKVKLKRVRRSLATAPNCSGSAAEQRDFRGCSERQLGVHRGRQAPR